MRQEIRQNEQTAKTNKTLCHHFFRAYDAWLALPSHNAKKKHFMVLCTHFMYRKNKSFN